MAYKLAKYLDVYHDDAQVFHFIITEDKLEVVKDYMFRLNPNNLMYTSKLLTIGDLVKLRKDKILSDSNWIKKAWQASHGTEKYSDSLAQQAIDNGEFDEYFYVLPPEPIVSEFPLAKNKVWLDHPCNTQGLRLHTIYNVALFIQFNNLIPPMY